MRHYIPQLHGGVVKPSDTETGGVGVVTSQAQQGQQQAAPGPNGLPSPVEGLQQALQGAQLQPSLGGADPQLRQSITAATPSQLQQSVARGAPLQLQQSFTGGAPPQLQGRLPSSGPTGFSPRGR